LQEDMSGLHKNEPKVYKKYNIIDIRHEPKGRRPTTRQNRTQKKEEYGQTQIKSPHLFGIPTKSHSRSPKEVTHQRWANSALVRGQPTPRGG